MSLNQCLTLYLITRAAVPHIIDEVYNLVMHLRKYSGPAIVVKQMKLLPVMLVSYGHWFKS